MVAASGTGLVIQTPDLPYTFYISDWQLGTTANLIYFDDSFTKLDIKYQCITILLQITTTFYLKHLFKNGALKKWDLGVKP